MKRFTKLITLVFLTVTILNSCKKDKNKSEVIIEYPIVFFYKLDIDKRNVDTFVELESVDFPTELDGELAKNNTTKSKIKSAKLISLKIQIPDYVYADTINHCNLKDISEILVDIKKDGLGQKLVARKLVPDVRSKGIVLDLEDVELREYLQKDNFRMLFRYKKRRAMNHDMPFIISVKFKITADPI